MSTKTAVIKTSNKRKAPAAGGAGKAPKRKRRPRFNPMVPSNFLNLPEVWRYRDSLRRNLQKYEDRLLDDPSDDDKRKVSNNIKRYRRDLKQLEEHQSDVNNAMKFMMDYALTANRLEDSHQAFPLIEQFTQELGDGLSVVAPLKPGAAEDDGDEE